MSDKGISKYFSTHEKGCKTVPLVTRHFEKKTTYLSKSCHLKYDWENIVFDNYSKGSVALTEMKFF